MATATDNSARAKANLAVTTGPDRGRTLPVTEELVHIGRSPENHLVLSDDGVADHQLSIVFRGGRFAIYTPLEQAVEVDGNVIPHARWVWLPETAKIRVSERTVLQFAETGAAAVSTVRDAAADSVTAEAPKKNGVKPAPKKRKKEAAVAKFITDRSGESLVKLGEDGQLPELSLTEAADRAATREKPKETNPLLVYGLLAMSFVASGALLLIDVDLGGSAAQERAEASVKLKAFYGAEGQPIAPWQQLLRDARLSASRGDRVGERRAYRRVLEMVNSEDNNKFTGLTGDPKRDDELRGLIGTMLRSE